MSGAQAVPASRRPCRLGRRQQHAFRITDGPIPPRFGPGFAAGVGDLNCGGSGVPNAY